MGGGASSLPEETQAALSDETMAAIEGLSESAQREIIAIAGMMELPPAAVESSTPRATALAADENAAIAAAAGEAAEEMERLKREMEMKMARLKRDAEEELAGLSKQVEQAAEQEEQAAQEAKRLQGLNTRLTQRREAVRGGAIQLPQHLLQQLSATAAQETSEGSAESESDSDASDARHDGDG